MNIFNFSELKFPIIQAPMAGGFNTPELASVVANSGGVGSFGFSFTSPEKIDKILNTTKKLTSGFINANFFVFKPVKLPDKEVQKEALKALESLSLNEKYNINIPKEPFYYDLESQIEATLKNLPSIITFHLGIPSIDIIKKTQSFGIKVGITATNITEAKSIENVGADFIVAQGIEAGGHRGIFDQENIDEKISLDNLLIKVLNNVSLPVVAAGGIMEGKHIKRVMNIGAKAAQLGTAFLTCHEAGTSEIHKHYLLNKQKRKTKITKAFSGRMARGIKNKFIEEMSGKTIFPFPIQNSITTPLRKVSQNNNNGEFINLWAGINFNKVRNLSAKELMKKLAEEFKAEN
jgi:nitronate monooxygenase